MAKDKSKKVKKSTKAKKRKSKKGGASTQLIGGDKDPK